MENKMSLDMECLGMIKREREYGKRIKPEPIPGHTVNRITVIVIILLTLGGIALDILPFIKHWDFLNVVFTLGVSIAAWAFGVVVTIHCNNKWYDNHGYEEIYEQGEQALSDLVIETKEFLEMLFTPHDDNNTSSSSCSCGGCGGGGGFMGWAETYADAATQAQEAQRRYGAAKWYAISCGESEMQAQTFANLMTNPTESNALLYGVQHGMSQNEAKNFSKMFTK